MSEETFAAMKETIEAHFADESGGMTGAWGIVCEIADLECEAEGAYMMQDYVFGNVYTVLGMVHSWKRYLEATEDEEC